VMIVKSNLSNLSNTMKKSLLVLLLAVSVTAYADKTASARSWWGTGYRNPAWVLAHGGTVVYYEIVANGASDRYKAVMYQDGKFVEVENGKKGKFDDPKNNVYTITAFQGGIERHKTERGGKKLLSSGPIVARPGETIWVVFDVNADKVSVSSDRRIARPAAPKKTVPVAAEKKKVAEAVRPEIPVIEKSRLEKIPSEISQSGSVCLDQNLDPVNREAQRLLWPEINLPSPFISPSGRMF